MNSSAEQASRDGQSLAHAQLDAVDLCRSLLRYDTTNLGVVDGARERPAAEQVAEWLTDAGLRPEIYESAPGRANVVARVEGRDPRRPALLVHGHLDVVPAVHDEWTLPPFAGEIADDLLWGRGAVDMKDFIAMVVAVVRHWHRTGRRPERDIVLAFLADEEAGSRLGSAWMVERHAELFADCDEAISEVGGFSWTTPNGQRLYLVETAQKGIAWRRLRATGTSGHAALPRSDNAVTEIAAALARIGSFRWPVVLTETVEHFIAAVSRSLGAALDVRDGEALERQLGQLSRLVIPSLSHTAAPTAVHADGGSVNVIPAIAEAVLDCRFLPGLLDDFESTLSGLAGPNITIEDLYTEQAIQHPFQAPLVDAMTAALLAEDAGAAAVPYCLPAGTDNTAFARLGIRGYGFTPLRLPSDFDFGAMFHGVDERIPVAALQFGTRVLARFLERC